jgi:hypothetical protein
MTQNNFRSNILAMLKYLRNEGVKGTIIANSRFITVIGAGNASPIACNDNEPKP